MADENRLVIEVRARDAASRVLRGVRNVVGRLNRSVLGGLRRIRQAVFSFRTLFAGVLAGAALTTFTNFEQGMAQVATLVDTSKVSVRQLSDEVLELGKATGATFPDLTKGLFDTISAGVAAEDAISFLGTAAKLGIGGGTDVASAIKGVVSVLNAFGLETSQAEEVADSLFQAMKGGITTVGLLASNIGKLAPVARQAGLTVDETFAAVSALTKGGLGTEEAITAMRSALSAVIKPSTDAGTAAKELNLNWTQGALASMGLADFLGQLASKTEATAEQQSALGGSIRGFVGLASLAADGAKNLTGILDSMDKKSGSVEEAFGKVNNTVGRSLARALRTAQASLIKFVGVFADDIQKAADGFAAFVDRNEEGLKRFAQRVRAAFALVGEIISEFFSPEGNNAQAAAKFWGETYVAILKAQVKVLVTVLVSMGRTLGNAFILGLGEEVRKGINELVTDVVDFGLGFGDEIFEKLTGIDVTDFKLLDESDEAITKRVAEIIAKTKEDLTAAGKTLKDDIAAALRNLESGGASGSVKGRAAFFRLLLERPELANRVDEFIEKLRALGATSADIEDELAAFRDILADPKSGVVSAMGFLNRTLIDYQKEADKAAEKAKKLADQQKAAAKAAKQQFDILRPLTGPGGALAGLTVTPESSDLTAFRREVFDRRLATIASGLQREILLVRQAAAEEIQIRKEQFGEEAGAKEVLAAFEKVVTKEALQEIARLRKEFADREKTEALARAQERADAVLEITRLELLNRASATEEAKLRIQFQFEDELARFKELLDKKLISEEEFQRARQALQDGAAQRISALAEKEFDSIGDFIEANQERLKGILADNITDFFTGIIDGTKTVQEAFRDMVTGILREIGRLLIQKAVANLIGSLFPTTAARGAIFQGGFTPLPSFASGGVATGPTLGIIGDNPSRREAMVPLPDGRSIPVKMDGGMGNVSVNFQFASLDPRTSFQIFQDNRTAIKTVFIEALNADPNFVSRARARLSPGAR